MSRIVLDTSVFVPDFRMRSATLRAVLKSARDLRDELLVPAVVVDELVNKFREDLETAREAFVRARGRLFGLLDQKRSDYKVDVALHVDEYAKWLQAEFKSQRIDTLDYPNAGHEDLVRRALERRKPFTADGQRGYRDALIWESVLCGLRYDSDETFFVSRNTRDFADPDREDLLHPDLLSDIESLHKRGLRFRFFPGLEELLAGGMAPRQKVLPELRSDVESGRLGQRDLRTWLAETLPGMLNRARDRWYFSSKRRGAHDWAVGKLHLLKQISLSSTSALTASSILVILFVHMTADLVPRQLELGTDAAADYGIQNPTNLLTFVAVELELGSKRVLSAEVDRVSVLEEGMGTGRGGLTLV